MTTILHRLATRFPLDLRPDLIQFAQEELLRSTPPLDCRDPVAWSSTVASRAMSRAARRQTRENAHRAPLGDAEQLAGPGDPESDCIAAERSQALIDGMAQLPRHLQTLLWLRYGEGVTLEWAALYLDCSVSTVRRREQDALSALRNSDLREHC